MILKSNILFYRMVTMLSPIGIGIGDSAIRPHGPYCIATPRVVTYSSFDIIPCYLYWTDRIHQKYRIINWNYSTRTLFIRILITYKVINHFDIIPFNFRILSSSRSITIILLGIPFACSFTCYMFSWFFFVDSLQIKSQFPSDTETWEVPMDNIFNSYLLQPQFSALKSPQYKEGIAKIAFAKQQEKDSITITSTCPQRRLYRIALLLWSPPKSWIYI